MTNDSIKEGPAPGREASPAAAVPTVAKMPAPIIAPIPSKVMLKAPSVRLRLWPSCCAAARMSSRFFVRKIPRSKFPPPDQLRFDIAGQAQWDVVGVWHGTATVVKRKGCTLLRLG